MATRLSDLVDVPRGDSRPAATLEAFRGHPRVSALRWPAGVVEQWLYDHPSHFLADYGHIDLETVTWSLEVVPTPELVVVSTGASGQHYMKTVAENPEHYVNVRNVGVHVGVRETWEVHGTWKRWPLLIDRGLVDGEPGLQVVEGRTRVGVLQGRARDGLKVAGAHLCWVGRLRN